MDGAIEIPGGGGTLMPGPVCAGANGCAILSGDAGMLVGNG